MALYLPNIPAFAVCCAGYTPEDPMILFLPAFHVFGQNFIMNGTFQACATLVLH